MQEGQVAAFILPDRVASPHYSLPFYSSHDASPIGAMTRIHQRFLMAVIGIISVWWGFNRERVPAVGARGKMSL